MKPKFLYYILFAASILTMSACTESDDESGNDTPPAGSLPSAEFKPNNLPDEPYAEDAIRIEAQDEQAPFYAIELMPDGHYLLSITRPYYYHTSSVRVAAKADGNFSISKKRNNETVRARSTRADDGTIILPTGECYGEFTKLGDKKYRLGNGDEIDLMDVTGSTKTVAYKKRDGDISTVYVGVSESITGDEARSLCRTWNYNSLELWGYWNGNYIVHAKQTLSNGKVDTYFKAIDGDLSREDVLDYDDELCEKIIFTSTGKYFCFYLDGDIEVRLWQWVDKSQGVLHYEDYMENGQYDEDYDGHVTVRFAGNQMRIYEDYTGDGERIVVVNTLTAANY